MVVVSGLHVGVADLAVLLCWLTSLALYGLVLMQPQLIGRPRRHRLSPASMRLIATGSTDSIALTASLLQLAATGYVAILDSEEGLILQRTWRQEAKELDEMDAVVANALFRGKPTHCPLSTASQEIFGQAQAELDHAAQHELLLARLQQAAPCLWAITVPLIVGLVILVATGRAPLLDMLFVAGALLAILLNILIKNTGRYGEEGLLIFISLVSMLALEGWRRALLLLLITALALAAKQRLSNVPAAHRSLARYVETRARELVASRALSPTRFVRDYPVAVALEATKRWIGGAAADSSVLAALRPRWYQAPDRHFDPTAFAQRLGQTVTALLPANP